MSFWQLVISVFLFVVIGVDDATAASIASSSSIYSSDEDDEEERIILIFGCVTRGVFPRGQQFDEYVYTYFGFNFGQGGTQYLINQFGGGDECVGATLLRSSQEINRLTIRLLNDEIKGILDHKDTSIVRYRIHRLLGVVSAFKDQFIRDREGEASLKSITSRIPYHIIYRSSKERKPFDVLLVEMRAIIKSVPDQEAMIPFVERALKLVAHLVVRINGESYNWITTSWQIKNILLLHRFQDLRSARDHHRTHSKMFPYTHH